MLRKNSCTTFTDGFHHPNVLSYMTYNRLGNTDMKVSLLSFGGAQLGDGYNTAKEEEGICAVRRALKLGFNYIDTSPWYGFGTAEIVLGKALKGIPRNSYYVATKVGRYKSNCLEMFDFSAEKTLRSIDESLSKLEVNYVDVIQVHDLEFAPSLDIILKETLPTLEHIKKMGKARYIGITGYPLDKLASVLEQSTVPIDTVLSYCRCTLFDQSLLNYIDYFKGHGVGIINAAVLGMGLLSLPTLPSWHPAQEEVRNACSEAQQYCQAQSVDLPKLATHFALSMPGIDTHLVGMSEPDLVHQNLETHRYGLTEKEREVMEHIQERFFKTLKCGHWENVEVEKYWKKVSALKKSAN